MCKHPKEEQQSSRRAHHHQESKNQSHWQSALMVLTECTASNSTQTRPTEDKQCSQQTPRRQQHSYKSEWHPRFCGIDAFLAKISSALLCSSHLLNNDNWGTQFLDCPNVLTYEIQSWLSLPWSLLRLIQNKPKHYQELLPTLSYWVVPKGPLRKQAK